MKHFETKEDFFNRANDKLKDFAKMYCIRELENGVTDASKSYLASSLVECGFKYVTFSNKALNDIFRHYQEVYNEKIRK